MKNRGFTLIELLAVIVVLGIIMLIAVTAVNGVITKSRLSSFNTSSDMLEKAASTYVHATNTSVAQGTTTTILYSDLKSSGFMERVVDPISKNECTNSRVYVTNTNGTYTYKGALACDNYMDIDAYNLITNSDFSNGTTGWTIYYGSTSISNKVVSITGAGSNFRLSIIYNSSLSAPIGHVFYIRSRTKVTGTGATKLYLVNSLNQGVTWKTEKGVWINNPTSGNWYNLSTSFTVPSTPTGIDSQQPQLLVEFPDAASSNGKILGIDGNVGMYTINLTDIYGAGNEPTAAQMDKIMNNMGK
jgi:prepilin-type N-terminal cleavage/methylation domain-containing protein